MHLHVAMFFTQNHISFRLYFGHQAGATFAQSTLIVFGRLWEGFPMFFFKLPMNRTVAVKLTNMRLEVCPKVAAWGLGPHMMLRAAV